MAWKVKVRKPGLSVILVVFALMPMAVQGMEDTVYSEDFSMDPGWFTDQPWNFYWDAPLQAYRVTAENAGGLDDRHAGTAVPYQGGSMKLEVDVEPVSLPWSTAFPVGLFNEELNSDNGFVLDARGVCIVPGHVDGGRYFALIVTGGSGVSKMDILWNCIEGIWYHCVVEYDALGDTITCSITERETGNPIGTLQVSEFGGLPSDLDYLGVVRAPAGWNCPTGGYDCSASATGYIDNICFTIPVPDPELRIETVATSTCGIVGAKVFLTSLAPVDGFSFGVKHDPAVLEAVDVTWSGASAALRGGQGPGFWFASNSALVDGCPDARAGITAALIGSTEDPLGNSIPPSADSQEIATIFYRPVAGIAVGAESALELVDCLMSGPDTEQTKCVLTINGVSVTPIRGAGRVLIERSCFQRGDCNQDDSFDISDPIGLLDYLFSGVRIPPCLEACNAVDDQELDISDPIRMLGRLFLGADPLPPPYKECGDDPTLPTLSCDDYQNC